MFAWNFEQINVYLSTNPPFGADEVSGGIMVASHYYWLWRWWWFNIILCDPWSGADEAPDEVSGGMMAASYYNSWWRWWSDTYP